jgi:hypothetical protein
MKSFTYRSILFALFALILYSQTTFAQEVLSSVHVNVQNSRLSGDQKTISYDVYFQNVNADTAVAVASYLFRLSVPQSELGTNAKTVTVTNVLSAVGVRGATMTGTPTSSPTHWLMKFQSSVLVSSYESAPQILRTFPGTFIGTFNITNTDGTTFANPQDFTATYAGDNLLAKTTVSVFIPNTTTLAPNSSTAMPIDNFSGLGVFSLTANKTPLTASDPTITLSKVYNGSTTAAVTAGTLSGVSVADAANVTLNATADYNNAKVGVGKTITVNYSLSGSAMANYAAPVSKTYTTGVISSAPLSITGVTASDKVYDGTTTATLSGGSLVGVFEGDDVTLVPGVGVFEDANLGTNKMVTASGYSISGADALNYALSSQPTGLTASITKDPSALVLLSNDSTSVSLLPNPASDHFYINIGKNKTAMLTIFDLRSCKVLSQLITGSAKVNISSLLDGIYIVDVNGIRKKLLKK